MRYLVVTLGSIALVALFEGVRQTLRWLDERRKEELRRRLQSLGQDLPDANSSLLRQRKLSASPALDEILRAMPFALRVEKLLEQSDTSFTVAQVMGWSVLAACGGLLAGLLLKGGLLVTAVLALAGFAAPTLGLLVSRSRRSARISEQLPEALDMLARSLRAGHALSASFEVVAKEMPEPVAVEFGRAYESQRLGVPVEEALVLMADRVPGNGDVKMLVVSATIQRETGGNLAEILSNLAETIRSRYKFQGKLRALTAEGRASAFVLALLPLIVTAGLNVMNPGYLTSLVTTNLGRGILAYAIGTWVVGVVWLQRMSKVDY